MTGTFCKAMLASNPDPSEGGGGGGGRGSTIYGHMGYACILSQLKFLNWVEEFVRNF